MRRLILLSVGAVAIVAFMAWYAFAAVTWHSGPTVTFNADHTCVTITGNASGLGNKPAVAHVTVNGSVTYTCENKGGNQAPGANPVPATGSADQDLGNSDHNGRGALDLTVCITALPTVNGKVAGCPNGNWTGVNPVPFPVPITGGTLTITQGNATIYGPVAL